MNMRFIALRNEGVNGFCEKISSEVGPLGDRAKRSFEDNGVPKCNLGKGKSMAKLMRY
jgi:hypothetical protein